MFLQLLVFSLSLAIAGCHSIAGYQPVQGRDAARPIDGLDLDSPDASPFDGNVDGIPPDSSVDLLRYVDGRPLTPPPPCTFVPAPDDGIWVHRFDAPSGLTSPLPSELRAEIGTPLQLIGQNISRVRGPGGCGEALSFDTTWGGYGVIDDDLRLVEGTISVWVRFTGDGRLEGILSRDRTNSDEAGHLSLMRTAGGHIVLRLQTTDTTVPGQQDLLCSAHRAPSGLWHHIRIAFGGGQPPTLEVNGSHELLGGPLQMQGEMIWNCTLDPQVTHGIEGNTLPLAVGATLMFWSGSGTLYPKNYLQGAIDEIVIRGQRLRR